MFNLNTCAAERTLVSRARQLRIAVPAFIAHTLIAPALPRFLEQYPDARIELLISPENGKPERCDAAICVRPLDAKYQWPMRRLAVLFEVLCASEAFLDVHKRPRDPSELNPAHCIGVVDAHTSVGAWSFAKDTQEITVVPAAPLVFSDSQSAVAAAVRGAGFIRVPALAVEAHIAAGLLRPLLMDWTPPNRAVWFKSASPMTPELETFAEFVAGLLPSEAAALYWE